jgi:hypothetical protein
VRLGDPAHITEPEGIATASSIVTSSSTVVRNESPGSLARLETVSLQRSITVVPGGTVTSRVRSPSRRSKSEVFDASLSLSPLGRRSSAVTLPPHP